MEHLTSRRSLWRRRLLGVRSLMVLILIVAAGLGWVINRAAVQRDAVKAIEAAGGTVKYDFQQTPWFSAPNPPPGPKWLVDRLGIDFFANVTSVDFRMPPRNPVVYDPTQSDVILADIGRLTRLEELDANSVRVTDAGMARLARLTKLRTLAIVGTPELTDAGLAHLAGLERLETVAIDGTTSIEGPGLAHLAGLKRLGYLRIRTKTDKSLDSLSRLTKLKKLFLNVANVTEDASAQISRLTWLKELALGGAAGSNAGLAQLKGMTGLEQLQLAGTWLTDEGMAPVSEMDHLSTFFVGDRTSVTPGGLYRLQQQRPGLRIGINGSGKVPKARLDLMRRSVGPDAVPPEL